MEFKLSELATKVRDLNDDLSNLQRDDELADQLQEIKDDAQTLLSNSEEVIEKQVNLEGVPEVAPPPAYPAALGTSLSVLIQELKELQNIEHTEQVDLAKPCLQKVEKALKELKRWRLRKNDELKRVWTDHLSHQKTEFTDKGSLLKIAGANKSSVNSVIKRIEKLCQLSLGPSSQDVDEYKKIKDKFNELDQSLSNLEPVVREFIDSLLLGNAQASLLENESIRNWLNETNVRDSLVVNFVDSEN